jgi:pyruvate dehydrogenase phosphatase
LPRGRIFAATYPANNPTEDRHQTVTGKQFGNWPNRSSPYNLAAVFDGHGGWQVAQMAQDRLLEEIMLGLSKATSSANPTETEIDQSILTAFKNVENEYVERVRESYRLGFGEVAKVGCCALVALQKDNSLFIANAGDCRAVLGRNVSTAATSTATSLAATATTTTASQQRLLAVRITHDHNAREPLELLTLQREHPGEADVVVCKTPHACYVKGRLQLTRALGDAYLKYSEFNRPDTYRGRHIPEPYTPPYVKATPDVHHVHLTPEDAFLIMASDGLWDFLSDEDAVAVVEKCIRDGNAQGASEALVQAALQVAANECGMSLANLKALPPGNSRRNRHDDTTAVVLYL